ncbi:MAG: hypothetical protein IPJ36_04585 [Simplicispira sp.]|nr:hypothetical protein [Simplicispira sp.]
MLVLEDQKRMIYHPDKRKIGTRVTDDFSRLLEGPSGSFIQHIGNADVLLSYTQIPDKQWYVVSIVPESTICWR